MDREYYEMIRHLLLCYKREFKNTIGLEARYELLNKALILTQRQIDFLEAMEVSKREEDEAEEYLDFFMHYFNE